MSGYLGSALIGLGVLIITLLFIYFTPEDKDRPASRRRP